MNQQVHLENKIRDAVYPVDEFRTILRRERARVDRNGHHFSLVTFKLDCPVYDQRRARELIRILEARIRSTDILGWYRDCELSIFLPEISEQGAKKFSQDVCRLLGETVMPPPYTIYFYPDRRTTEGEPDWSSWHRPDGVDDRISKLPPKRRSRPSVDDAPETMFALRTPLWKRLMDIFGAGLGLVVLSPLFLLIAVYIRIVSRGPVFYKHDRVGYKGETFKFLKFRTMRMRADQTLHKNHFEDLMKNDIPMTKLDVYNDPRLIPFGKLLRQSSLDELPQLINVLKGDMSLIGPRPCLAYEADNFMLWHKKRFDVLPGITGYWQVNGKNKTTFVEMMRLDISYTQQLSFWTDLKILFRTFPAVIGQLVDSYRPQNQQP